MRGIQSVAVARRGQPSKEQQLKEGIQHMQFMVRLYKKQVDAGRVFVHENPAHAKSWALLAYGEGPERPGSKW